jgi:excisionase family DNA binding protein
MASLENEYMTTTEACEVLNVSKTVVKRMADDGTLQTWKTPGGHRRLKRSSVMKVVAEKSSGNNAQKGSASSAVNTLVIDDDKVVCELIEKVVKNSGVDTEFGSAQDGYEGLVKAG